MEQKVNYLPQINQLKLTQKMTKMSSKCWAVQPLQCPCSILVILRGYVVMRLYCFVVT